MYGLNTGTPKKDGWLLIQHGVLQTPGLGIIFNSFDLNHLSFVTYGKSSDTPAPPTSYYSNSQKKGGGVRVSFGKLSDIQSIKPSPLVVSFNLPTTTLGVVGVTGKVIFKNSSGIAMRF